MAALVYSSLPPPKHIRMHWTALIGLTNTQSIILRIKFKSLFIRFLYLSFFSLSLFFASSVVSIFFSYSFFSHSFRFGFGFFSTYFFLYFLSSTCITFILFFSSVEFSLYKAHLMAFMMIGLALRFHSHARIRCNEWTNKRFKEIFLNVLKEKKKKHSLQQTYIYQIHIINIVPRVYKSFLVFWTLFSFSHSPSLYLLHSLSRSPLSGLHHSFEPLSVCMYSHILTHTLCITDARYNQTNPIENVSIFIFEMPSKWIHNFFKII